MSKILIADYLQVEAQAQAQAQPQAQTQAKVKAQEQAHVQAQALAQERAQVDAQALAQASVQAQTQVQVQARCPTKNLQIVLWHNLKVSHSINSDLLFAARHVCYVHKIQTAPKKSEILPTVEFYRSTFSSQIN